MIKAGMWQAGTRLDLTVELLVKFHRTFGALIAGNLGYLGIHATGCSWRAAHSLGALIHVGERFEESTHTSIKQMHGRKAVCCNTACAVSLCKGCGVSLSKEKASNSAWVARNSIQRRGYLILKVLMNKRDVFKIRQVRGEASSVPPMPRKQCVEGLEFSPYAEKEAGLVTWLEAPYCLPTPAFLIACDPVL